MMGTLPGISMFLTKETMNVMFIYSYNLIESKNLTLANHLEHMLNSHHASSMYWKGYIEGEWMFGW